MRHYVLVAQRAAAMRAALTTSEQLLWQQLQSSRLGVSFRRQVPIGKYIADFCAHGIRLVVEVDGGYHAVRARADARRDRVLSRLGYRVVRVPAALVMQRLPEAVALVRAAIAGQQE